jgi:hypothetical protein
MNAKGKTAIKESKPKVTAATLMRLAGVSAVLAGLCFIVMGMFHPVNVPSAVTTTLGKRPYFCVCHGLLWTVWHGGALYQASGRDCWLGLAGFILFSRLDDARDGLFLRGSIYPPPLASSCRVFVGKLPGML